jgi:hypothetical protein
MRTSLGITSTLIPQWLRNAESDIESEDHRVLPTEDNRDDKCSENGYIAKI